MVLTYPGGQVVDVEFDDAAHSYVVRHKLADGQFSDWRPTHGITAPLAVVPRPYLQPWAAKESAHAVIEYLANNPLDPATLLAFMDDYELYNSKAKDPKTGKTMVTYYRLNKKYGWVKDAKSAYRRKSKDSQELGTWLHESIENFYASDRTQLPIVLGECQGMWDSFTEFDNYYKPKHEGLEFIVYSLQFGYSGQGDFRGTIANKYCIGDWKSTNRSDANPDGIDIDYFFQLGGLAQAEFERTGKWVDDLFIANLDKKGEEPRVVFASDFGASPQDMARAYINCFNTDKMIGWWDYRFKKK